jgi:hypothetical protein
MVQHPYIPGPNIAKGAEVDVDICKLRQSVARVRHTQAAEFAEGPAQAQQQQDLLQAHDRAAGTGTAHHSRHTAGYTSKSAACSGFGAPWVSRGCHGVPAETSRCSSCRTRHVPSQLHSSQGRSALTTHCVLSCSQHTSAVDGINCIDRQGRPVSS